VKANNFRTSAARKSFEELDVKEEVGTDAKVNDKTVGKVNTSVKSSLNKTFPRKSSLTNTEKSMHTKPADTAKHTESVCSGSASVVPVKTENKTTEASLDKKISNHRWR
jgi:hypothetical protein